MLKEKTERNGLLLVIKHHCICQESKEYREGWKEVEVFNPSTKMTQTKWIRPYDSVSGYIDKIEWYAREDEKSGKTFKGYTLHLTDGGESASLDLPLGSIPYQTFTKIAENLNYGEPVEFAAWHDRKRKKDKLAFGAKQGDTWIKHRYTVADPGECPPPVYRDLSGKWDFSEQEEWLKSRIDTEIVPIVEQWAAYRAANAPKVEVAPAPAPPVDERKAAVAAQAPTAPPKAAPRPQGPPQSRGTSRPVPPPVSDPYEGGQFDDESVPF